MGERFAESLKRHIEPVWSSAIQHRFVQNLYDGAVPDPVMAAYLVRDYRLLDSFLVLLGAALASSDTLTARLHFGRFIGMVSGQENDDLERAFQVLGLDEHERTRIPDNASAAGFKAIMREAADT